MSILQANGTDKHGSGYFLREQALALRSAGISFVPIPPDKTKQPYQTTPLVWDDAANEFSCKWGPLKSRLPLDREIDLWFSPGTKRGIASIQGKVSGNAELLDFDFRAEDIFGQWCELVEAEAPGLIARLNITRTPKPGFHVRYRCPGFVIPGNKKIAEEPCNGEDGKPSRRTLIESRGEGGYALAPGCPPECHETGRTYDHFSGPPITALPNITPAERDVLWRCARVFDEIPAAEPAEPKRTTTTADGWIVRPGDAFCERGWDWSEILTGWTVAGSVGSKILWRRPGKDGRGWSATTGYCTSKAGRELLYVFSSNAHPLEPEGKYNKFSAYALLHHNGDFTRATTTLLNMGFGEKAKGTSKTITATPAAEPIRLLPPYEPFPTDCLPLIVENYVTQVANAMRCDVSYVSLPALAVLASCIGNSRVIRLKRGWTEPCIVWSAIVAESGTLKSPAQRATTRYLYTSQQQKIDVFNAEYEQYEAALSDWLANKKKKSSGLTIGAEKPKEPKMKRVICSDTTLEKLAEILEDNPRGVLVARDELAGWLESFSRYKGKAGGTDLPSWLEMSQAGTVLVDRKTTNRKTTFIPRASVSITGTIQPGVLQRILTAAYMDSGLAARILMAMPTRMPKRWSDVEVDPETEASWGELLGNLLQLKPHESTGDPLVLNLSPGGKAAWVQFYDAWAEEQAATEGNLAACLAKLEAYAARFALLHHTISRVCEGYTDLTPVDEHSIAAGIQLAQWFGRESRRVYQMLVEGEGEKEIRKLVEWIRSRGGWTTVRDVRRASPSKYPTAESCHEALDKLVQAGVAEWQKGVLAAQGGRPTDRLQLITEGDASED